MPRHVNECLLYSLAMVLDCDLQEVRDAFPCYYSRLPDERIRGVHFQEVVDFLLRRGYACTLIESRSFIEGTFERPQGCDRFQNHIDASRGVLIGLNQSDRHHAVANDHGTYFDPAINTSIMRYYQYWRVDKIKSENKLK